ncbi:MAG: hypothetical protein KF883_02760 [Thermomicrobiales bacterium]|nr:hypothetical protein [Thermomicrobiales bacterium]
MSAQQPPGAQLATLCREAAAAGGTGALHAEVPEGVHFVVLADAYIDVHDAEVEVLNLLQWELGPDEEILNQMADSPLLLVVPDTGVQVYVQAKLLPAEEQGAVSVATHGLYSVANTTDEPIPVLSLQLAPKPSGPSVNQGNPTPVLAHEEDAGPAPVDLLYWEDVDGPGAGAVRGFVGCLVWDDPDAEVGPVQIEGTLGLRVLEGALKDSKLEGPLTPDSMWSCLPLEPGSVHNLSAGDAPPIVLVFGYLESGTVVWSQAAGSETSLNVLTDFFRCADGEG